MCNANIHMNSYYHKIVLAFQPIWCDLVSLLHLISKANDVLEVMALDLSHFQCQYVWFYKVFRNSQSSVDFCMWKTSWWQFESCLCLLVQIPFDILFDVPQVCCHIIMALVAELVDSLIKLMINDARKRSGWTKIILKIKTKSYFNNCIPSRLHPFTHTHISTWLCAFFSFYITATYNWQSIHSYIHKYIFLGVQSLEINIPRKLLF